MATIKSVEISFGAAVDFPDGWHQLLDAAVTLVCKEYEKQNPTRVMWPAARGFKPQWSQQDAAFLGVAVTKDAPQSGEPTFDEEVYYVECCEREDLYGENRLNPDRERLRAEARKAREQARQKTNPR